MHTKSDTNNEELILIILNLNISFFLNKEISKIHIPDCKNKLSKVLTNNYGLKHA